MGFYDYTIRNAKNEELPLRNYEGKVVMVVNTATGCGFTPQYKDIEALYEKYHDKGLEIIDIPCNQFYGQAPGTDEEIHEFCTLHFNTQFPQMKKSDVNGKDALPLYGYLKSQQGFRGFQDGPITDKLKEILTGIDKDYEHNPEIKWNFTKFIVDRKGNVVARFEPTADMKDVESCIASLL